MRPKYTPLCANEVRDELDVPPPVARVVEDEDGSELDLREVDVALRSGERSAWAYETTER